MNTQLSFKSHVALLSLLLVAILVVVQLIAMQHPYRIDLTATKRYTLSAKSIKVLSQTQEPIKAIAFFEDRQVGQAELEELFIEYQEVYPGFQFQFVDPKRHPGLTQYYQIESHGAVVLIYQGSRKTVVGCDEETLTNAMYQLLRKDKKVVYFLTGHGEKDIQGHLSTLGEILQGEHYQLKGLVMAQRDHVPDDAACLVIAGPKRPLFDMEIQAISTFMARGGSLLVMVDPYINCGLEDLLNQYGIELQADTIVDKASKILGSEFLFPVVTQYTAHALTKGLSAMSFFPVARSLALSKAENESLDLRAFARAGRGAWGETDRQRLYEGRAEWNPDVDIPGPLVIGAVATGTVASGKKRARLVVYGDSDFASNEYIHLSGNKDLILNTIAWLAEAEDLVTIRPRVWGYTPILLSQKQLKWIFWLSVVCLPLAVAGFGASMMLLRRWKR